jgi:RNA polymerase sigma-70 factor (ECF subfamily)
MSRSPLDRAWSRDEHAFGELTAPYVEELRLHCYRMLGSLVDAEDILQETLLAAWLGLDGYDGRASMRTWLYRIATNRCLNAIRDTKRRTPVEPVPPFDPPEPTRRSKVTWLQPFPDAWLVGDTAPGPPARFESHEATELAFVTALQSLPPRQTAALVLCDVLGFSLAETAAMIGAGATAVKGLLQRARAGLDDLRGADGHTDDGRPGSSDEQRLARLFAEAFSADDIDAVVALLTDRAWLTMPPAPHEYQGREAIARFLRVSAGWRPDRPVRLVATRANTRPAFGVFLADVEGSALLPIGMLVLTLSGDRVSSITRFLDAALPSMFGLSPP